MVEDKKSKNNSSKKKVSKKTTKKVSKKSSSDEASKKPDSEPKPETQGNPEAPKKQVNENKILKYTLLISGLIILLVIGLAIYIDSQKSFDYNNLEFKTISYGELILYQTSFPVMHQGKPTPFNVYFRTKPSKLNRIDFPEENFTAMKFTVLNIDEGISCDGDEVIAIANMKQVHDAINAQIMTDKNATCDDQGRYAYLELKPSEKTQITQTGKNCYDLEFANCEVLPVTEKYLAELLSDFLSE